MIRTALIAALIAGFTLAQTSYAVGQGKELSGRAKAMDTNKDGLVQKNEAQGALKSNFNAMDCDKNGGLDGAEISGFFTGAGCPKPAASQKKSKFPPLSDRAKAMDTNKDGLVQKNEAQGALKSNFSAMDCDKNGGLDGAEISGFFTGGCPTPAASQKKPKAQQVLKFASPSPARAPINWRFLRPWTKRVSAGSGGALKVELKTGRKLATALNVYDRVLSNVAQIGWGGQLMFRGKFQRSLVTGLPFLIKNSEEGSLALWRLYAKGIIKSEYDEVRPLALTTFPMLGFHTSKTPIKSLDDVKGLKIRSTSRLSAQLIKLLGGAPISLPFFDQYQAINRGTIDGTLAQWTIFYPFKLDEVTKHHLEGLRMGGFPGMVFITHKTYDSLTAAGRRAIDANSGEKFSRDFGKFWDGAQIQGRDYVAKKPGHTITEISAKEESKWQERMKPITTQWIKSLSDGQKILDALQAELANIRSGK